MAQQASLLPMVPVSHMDATPAVQSPVCSVYRQWGWPQGLGPYIHVGHLENLMGLWLQICPAWTNMVIWRGSQEMDLSLFFLLSLFIQGKKKINL